MKAAAAMEGTPFWTTRQLAAYFSVSHVTVAAWIKQGKLPAPRQHPHGAGRFWLLEDLRGAAPSKRRAPALAPAPPKGDPLPECNCDPLDGEPFDCICPTEGDWG